MNIRFLGKNIIYFAIGYTALRATAIILTPLYTRYFSVATYGLIDICIITIQILAIFMSLSMQRSAIRYYKLAETTRTVGTLYTTAFILNLAGGIFILLILGIFHKFFSSLIFGQEFSLWLLILVALAAFTRSFNELAMAYFRGQNKALPYTVYSILIMAGLLLTNILLVVVLKKEIYGILYSYIIVFTAGAVIVGGQIILKYKIRFSFPLARELFSFGFPLIFSMAGWFILHMSSRYFLRHYSGFEEVGIYGLGYRITTILLTVIVMPFQLAFGPFIFSLEDKHDLKEKISRIFTYLIFVLMCSSWGLAYFSRIVLKIFAPPDYNNSISVILILLPAVTSIGIYYWAASLLHLVKKTRIIGIIIVAAALINLILNRLLIPPYGWFGAALSTNLSILLACLAVFTAGLRYYRIKFENQRLVKLLLAFLPLLVIFVVSMNTPSLIYYTANGLTAFIVLFLLYRSNFLFKNEKDLINKLWIKIKKFKFSK